MGASRKSRSSWRRGGAGEPLSCPTCARAYPSEERFCEDCRMPLVPGSDGREDAAGGEARAYARKIRPEYARGELVRVAGGRNQAEAELIRNLLIEEGVPSMVRRAAGFDVPDFLAAGPRDVLVPHSGLGPAREVLGAAELAEEPVPALSGRASARRAAVIATAIVAGGLAAAGLAWLGTGAGS